MHKNSSLEDWENISEKIISSFRKKLRNKIRELDMSMPELPEGFLLDPEESVKLKGHCVFYDDCELYFSALKSRLYSLDLKSRGSFIEAYMKDEDRYIEEIASSKLYLTNKRLLILR